MTVSPKGVVVLGMHRSGTSCVSNVLVELGFEVPGTVLPANEGNPKGYWEPLTIVEIHDRFLHAVGRSWSDPSPLKAEFSSEAAGRTSNQLREFFSDVVIPCGRWVIKDPRMCRLMPLWKDLFEEHREGIGFLYVIRHPESVARSLQARDGFSRKKGYLLWLRHYIESECATRGERRAFVRFLDFATSSESESILSALRAVTASPRLSNQRLEKVLGKIFDRSQVHHDGRSADSSNDAGIHPWVIDGKVALDLSVEGKEAEARPRLDEVRVRVEAADALIYDEPAVWLSEVYGERFYLLQKEVERLGMIVEVQRHEVGAGRQDVEVARAEIERVLKEFEDEFRAVSESIAGAEESRQESQKALTGAVAVLRQTLARFQSSASAEAETFAEISDAVGESIPGVELMLENQLEQRHLALIEKSLEVTERIENELQQTRRDLESANKALEETETRMANEIFVLREEAKRAEGEHDRQLTALRADAAAARSEYEAELGALRIELAEARRQAQLERETELQEQLAGILKETQAVRAERDQINDTIQQILNSRSWRISSPLRSVARRLRGSSGES